MHSQKIVEIWWKQRVGMKTFDHSIYKILSISIENFILLNMKFDMKTYYFSNMFVLCKTLELVLKNQIMKTY
jgi:hypothetical protein